MPNARLPVAGMIIFSLVLSVVIFMVAFYLAFSGDWGAPKWFQYVAVGLSVGLMLQRCIGYFPSLLFSIFLNALIVYLALSIAIRPFRRSRRDSSMHL